MLLAVFSNFLTIISLFGYALVCKKVFLHKQVLFKIKNIDFFYGLLF